MKSSSKRLLALLGSAALILAAIIVYAVLLKPEYSRVQELRGQLESRIDFYDAQSQAIDYVNNLYGKNRVDIGQIQNDLALALPDQEEVAGVVYQIQAISALNAISIDSVNLERLPIQQSKAANSLVKNYGTLRATLKMSGAYSAFKELLKFLENNIRIMDVRTLRVYQTNIVDKTIFDYELIADTYYQIK